MREQLSLLRHLMAKDWRHVRGYALVSWLLALTLWLWLYYVDQRSEMLASLHGYAALLFPALVVVRLVQADAMLSTTSFCLTRPIDRTLILAAKLGATAAVVVVPA